MDTFENQLYFQSALTGSPLHELLADPYILLASGSIFYSNTFDFLTTSIIIEGAILLPEMAMAMLEATLPLWLIQTMQPEQWQLGMGT
jgi:DHA1 family solute carrier family 18 vesicular amine transporter 1/2